MKRAAALVSLTALALSLQTPGALAAEVDSQDFLILKQTVDSQQEAIDGLRRRLAEAESKLVASRSELEALRRSSTAMAKDSVTQDQLKALVGKVEQVDRTRADDSKRIYETFRKFAETPPVAPPVIVAPPAPRHERSDRPERTGNGSGGGSGPNRPSGANDSTPAPPPVTTPKPKQTVELPDLNYEHVVKTNETLSEILIAYRKQYNLKTTMAHVEAANPGLNPKKIRVGQKVNIPAVN